MSTVQKILAAHIAGESYTRRSADRMAPTLMLAYPVTGVHTRRTRLRARELTCMVSATLAALTPAWELGAVMIRVANTGAGMTTVQLLLAGMVGMLDNEPSEIQSLAIPALILANAATAGHDFSTSHLACDFTRIVRAGHEYRVTAKRE